MSNTTILILLGLFGLLVAWMLFYIYTGRSRAKQGRYMWQPAQDYDVVQEGESAMTPAWPKMVERKSGKAPNDHKSD